MGGNTKNSIKGSGSSTLQAVTEGANKDLVDGKNFQGTGAGVDNTGVDVIAFGSDAGNTNTGNNANLLGNYAGGNNAGENLNAVGNSAGVGNTGKNVNAIGNNTCVGNTVDNVNAFGEQAGVSNTFKNVNLFGYGATADAENQTVFSKWISGVTKYLGRLSFNNITANRKWELQDADGIILLDASTQRSTATSGTQSAPNTIKDVVFIHEAGATVSLTYEFPPNPIDKQRVTVMSVGGITTLTLSAVVGSIINTITTLAGGGCATYMYLTSQTKWYKVG